MLIGELSPLPPSFGSVTAISTRRSNLWYIIDRWWRILLKIIIRILFITVDWHFFFFRKKKEKMFLFLLLWVVNVFHIILLNPSLIAVYTNMNPIYKYIKYSD